MLIYGRRAGSTGVRDRPGLSYIIDRIKVWGHILGPEAIGVVLGRFGELRY